jgi:hypothetical protein
MFSNKTKGFLGVYSLLLLIIIFAPSQGVGIILIVLEAIVALIVSILIINHIKKYKNSLKSRILSDILVISILYSIVWIAYGFSNIGVGEKGLGAAFIFYTILIFCAISIIISIILTIRNKKYLYEGKLNKILLIVLIILLIPNFYNPSISSLAKLTESSFLCSLNLEIKDDSVIFQEGFKNSCLTNVAIKRKDVKICPLYNNSENYFTYTNCVRKIAYRYQDVSFCNFAGEEYSNCIYLVALKIKSDGNLDLITPEYCDVLSEKRAKDGCLKMFAYEKNDVEFCFSVDDFGNCFNNYVDIIQNYDESQCENITSDIAKESCLRRVNYEHIILKGSTSNVSTEGIPTIEP